MVKKVCLYFHVHQPFRMAHYSVFDIGTSKDYFDNRKNREILEKVARKCYIPTNNIILSLLNKHPEFKISYSITGILLDQLEEFAPEVLESFKELAKTGRVEFLAETYYHSLSSLYSDNEFKDQINLHKRKIKKLFGQTPRIFRNTELILNNDIVNKLSNLDFDGVLAEGADKILGWKSPNFVYTISGKPALLKNYKLSDDIAFRFSNKGWNEHPLTTEKFVKWVSEVEGDTINLFMDYETFGEHQWQDTGIFNFLNSLPAALLKENIGFRTVGETIKELSPVASLDMKELVSWADVERDVSAWLGNEMQNSSISKLYNFEKYIKLQNNKDLLEIWRKLQTSDHFYYMCTKWFADGDVHKYFNAYDSPYDAFIIFMNILTDLEKRISIKVIN